MTRAVTLTTFPFLSSPWWRHQMEIISALLTLCEGNPPVTGGFPWQKPVTRSKQSRRRWFEMPSHSLWRHCNDRRMSYDTTHLHHVERILNPVLHDGTSNTSLRLIRCHSLIHRNVQIISSLRITSASNPHIKFINAKINIWYDMCICICISTSLHLQLSLQLSQSWLRNSKVSLNNICVWKKQQF